MTGTCNTYFHVCRLSAGLDDLSHKEQGNRDVVLDVLRRTRRYSVFEATENSTIAATMTAICKSGEITTEDIGYPWIRVTAINGVPLP